MVDLTLTFDNGPEPSVTPGVLDTLERHGVLTTFFVIGSKLQEPAARSCVERARAAGHWIGNHTWTHTRPLGEQPGFSAVQTEIVQTQTALGSLASDPPLFRPMGGGGNLDRRLLSAEAATHLEAEAYTCVLWNAVPRDWADPDGWVDTAFAQIASNDWTLLVLHDLPTGAMRHLDGFLTEARYRGVQFKQAFPPACLPIVAGRPAVSLDRYVTPAEV